VGAPGPGLALPSSPACSPPACSRTRRPPAVGAACREHAEATSRRGEALLLRAPRAAYSSVRVLNDRDVQVDRRDSHVDRREPRAPPATLPAAPAGTYTVQWRVLSITDITEGAFHVPDRMRLFLLAALWVHPRLLVLLRAFFMLLLAGPPGAPPHAGGIQGGRVVTSSGARGDRLGIVWLLLRRRASKQARRRRSSPRRVARGPRHASGLVWLRATASSVVLGRFSRCGGRCRTPELDRRHVARRCPGALALALMKRLQSTRASPRARRWPWPSTPRTFSAPVSGSAPSCRSPCAASGEP